MDKNNASKETWIRRIAKVYVKALKKKRDSLSNMTIRSVTAFGITAEVEPQDHPYGTAVINAKIDLLYQFQEKMKKKGIVFDGVLYESTFNRILAQSKKLHKIPQLAYNKIEVFDAKRKRLNTLRIIVSMEGFIMLFFSMVLLEKPFGVVIFSFFLVSFVLRLIAVTYFINKKKGFINLLLFPDLYFLRSLFPTWFENDNGAPDDDVEVLFKQGNEDEDDMKSMYLKLPSFTPEIAQHIKRLLELNYKPYLVLDRRDIFLLDYKPSPAEEKINAQYCYLICVTIPDKLDGSDQQYKKISGIISGLPNYELEECLTQFVEKRTEIEEFF